MTENESSDNFVDSLTAEYNEKGQDIFTYEWDGTRMPKIVIFPNSLEKTVSYMRDGTILFMDNTNARYKRLADDYPKQPQRIFVAYKLSMHKKD